MTVSNKNGRGWISLLCAAIAGLLCGCQGIVQSDTAELQVKVNHIIFLMQENRSFDSYFGKLNDYRAATFNIDRGTDDLESVFTNPADDGSSIGNFHITSTCIDDDTAAWEESWGDMNRFDAPSGPLLLDGFVHTGGGYAISNGFTDTKGVRAMGFYDGGDLTLPYWFATQFATSDRFYTPAPVQTQVARLWSMAATSGGFVHPLEDTGSHLSQTTIFQMLDQASVTWKIYSVDTGADGKLITTLRDFEPYGGNQESRIVPIAQYFTDLQNGTLPQFAYIEPSFNTGRDEHPGQGTSIQAGADFAGSLIRALINSSSWQSSIFIETFDEGGGLFDHVGPMIDGQPIQELSASAGGQSVGPGVYATDAKNQHVPSPDGIAPVDLGPNDPAGDFTRTGFRVPLMIVSPFARKNFVSHTAMDTTAVLKLVETRFQLNNLTKRDGAQPDMLEFFDFVGSPNLTPPSPPVQPTGLPCNPGSAAAALGTQWTPP